MVNCCVCGQVNKFLNKKAIDEKIYSVHDECESELINRINEGVETEYKLFTTGREFLEG